MFQNNIIVIEDDKTKYDTDSSNDWTVVKSKKNKNKYVAKLLDEILLDAINNEKSVLEPSIEIDKEDFEDSYNKVSKEYLKYITSYTKEDIEKSIEKLKLSDNKFIQESNYVMFDCRIYLDNKEVDTMSFNKYKFDINKFYKDEKLVRKIKEHYKQMGYNIGFSYKLVDEVPSYTHIKFYFK